MATPMTVSLPCTEGGFTVVTWNGAGVREGSADVQLSLRIVRRKSGAADVILPGKPNTVFGDTEDIRSWQWIDADIPADGTYVYGLQMYRFGTTDINFNEMTLTAQHFKR